MTENKYKNRIIGYEYVEVDDILFNPANWRIHPARQQDAVNESLEGVGWVEPVLVNLRTSEEWGPGDRNVKTLIDGHLRVTLAGRKGEKTVPVLYVDLTPEEEEYILATLDPLGALAVVDRDKLLDLVSRQDQQTHAINSALRASGIDFRKTFGHVQAGADAQETKETKTYSDKPADGGSSAPKDRERYPLAIVLDRRLYERWQTWKNSIGVSSDTEALRSLLDKVIAEVA